MSQFFTSSSLNNKVQKFSGSVLHQGQKTRFTGEISQSGTQEHMLEKQRWVTRDSTRRSCVSDRKGLHTRYISSSPMTKQQDSLTEQMSKPFGIKLHAHFAAQQGSNLLRIYPAQQQSSKFKQLVVFSSLTKLIQMLI